MTAIEVINYFRTNLKRRLKRPNCGRYLPLWDDKQWIKREVDIDLDYIVANEFVVFLYQTKDDTCCMENSEGKMLSNAIDKFLFLSYDFQGYFNILIKSKMYTTRAEIIEDISQYRRTNIFSNKYVTRLNFLEVFLDLNKKLNEWMYWKRQLIINFIKIILSKDSYAAAQKHSHDYLIQLISYIEKLFNKGINS